MTDSHHAWVCRCEDVDLAEVEEALEAGFTDLESLRRYTAIGTGPCQGKACIAETIRLLARHHGVDEGAIGQATLRPPHSPVPLGALAAIDPELLHGLLDDADAKVARAEQEALSAEDRVRTGRPTPTSIERSLESHRALMRESLSRKRRGNEGNEGGE